MDPTPPAPAPPLPEHGLPTVQPPSGQMILRLFLVPFLIVAVLVGLYLIGQTFLGKSRSAKYYLDALDNANPDIRWRAASDLSQELPRSPQLAADAAFALELADRFQKAVAEGEEPEKEFAAKFAGLGPDERAARVAKDLDPRRKLVMFLGASLANFTVPVAVPALRKLALQTSGMEAEALAERRRRALFALAVQGESMRRYDEKLTDEQRDKIDEELSEAVKSDRIGSTAREARDHLARRRLKKADSFGTADLMATCAEDGDPSIRMYAAYLGHFWYGTATEDAKMEETLARLSKDAGTGEDERASRLKLNPDRRDSTEITTSPGYEVRANANLALARRGSPKVRPDLLEEMLSPEKLREVFRLRDAEGKEAPNEALVVATVIGTVKAVGELAAKRKELKLDRINAAIDALAGDGNAAVRTAATELKSSRAKP